LNSGLEIRMSLDSWVLRECELRVIKQKESPKYKNITQSKGMGVFMCDKSIQLESTNLAGEEYI